MVTTKNTTEELVETLRRMEVGETRTFSAERANSVRATASNYGFQWGRCFTTKANRQERTVTVKRIS